MEDIIEGGISSDDDFDSSDSSSDEEESDTSPQIMKSDVTMASPPSTPEPSPDVSASTSNLKRERQRSPITWEHQSPLSRVYRSPSPMRFGKRPRISSNSTSRSCKTSWADRVREAAAQRRPSRPFRKPYSHPRNGPLRNGPPRAPPLLKLFDISILPKSGEPKLFLPVPSLPCQEAEKTNDKYVLAMAQRAMHDVPISSKQLTANLLPVKFKPLLSIVRYTPNYYYWVSMRKETIASANLCTVAAFLDESLCWGQQYLKNDFIFSENGKDIILDTSSALLSQLVHKIKMLPFCHCLMQTTPQDHIVKQVCYLIASNNRILDAVRYLQTSVIKSPIVLLLAYAVCLPAAIICTKNETQLYSHCMRILKEYRPGDVMNILHESLTQHLNKCPSSTCAYTTRAIVGTKANTTGLFFLPTQ
ncbi:unnamed protein product [Saimiriine gammaherpesvirus 2]|uniref:mRNA export factor ICP27 homolog n=2 Tax=Saimiriine herpesvirus 2 TaxID=10381 RepID=ICP27_SHV21|nr:unnamed protein product [Saimiriine gammaherpesvirus 2]P13199.2 RecName: Full=mRNA export factor ICP27 homolog; AltName: Full=52 kDa immediate-early phosphoprotein; AltName: Full=EB2 protein homolog [Herpesvirus saimiri (strain 11)]pir/WMBEHA/ 52K immediate-early protein - saimiriine herpesvirus 1 (strain 11) [Saimiriine alphaherpesvirus 1]CAA45680.1 unnamed protein product [Saimiriine gammaherpesvirus 2]